MFDRIIGIGLALIAVVVYGVTLSVGAYPGESATRIVQAAGLFPHLSPSDPLWNGIAYIVSLLSFVDMTLVLNCISALCGAMSVWLLYDIVAGAIFNVINAHVVSGDKRIMAARIAGLASALFLAFSVPFWIVSNRAHPASLHILIMLGLTRLFMGFINTRSVRILIIFAFLYGLAVVEFATMIVLAPLFGGYILFDLWKNEEFSVKLVLQAVGAGMAGLAAYFVVAWFFYDSEGYHLREYQNYIQVVWFMWRDQYFLISQSLPRLGWLMVLIVTIVPWMTCLAICNKALNEEKDWAYYILHAVMTGLAMCVMFNAYFAPWPMLKLSKFLVTPYVLTASVFGYLAAYWYLLPSTLWLKSESPGLVLLGKNFGLPLAIIFLLSSILPAFLNFSLSNGRTAGVIDAYAREMVRGLSSRQKWLVTDGILDNHLLLAARDSGRSLNVLNLRLGDDPVYLKYISKQFNRPRLKNLTGVGLYPLLQEYMLSDTNAGSEIAVAWPSDLWIGAGYSVVPQGLVFSGSTNVSLLLSDSLLDANKRARDTLLPLLRNTIGDKMLTQLAMKLLANLSTATVNLGCLMEDLGRKDDAFRLYSDARTVFAGNISALLNQSTMIEAGYKSDQATSVRKDITGLMSNDMAKRPDIWSLSRSYGYVRRPEAFAQLGMTWAYSGHPGAAVVGLKKAIDLLPDDRKGRAKQVLADVYLAQQNEEESEPLYFELLVKNPENRDALLGMARVCARKHEFKKALEYLKKAEAAGLAKPVVAVEMAQFNLMAGNLAQARVGLEEIVDLKVERATAASVGRAWMMLIGVYVQQRDLAALQKCVERIEENKAFSRYLLYVAKGHVCLVQQKITDARKLFESAASDRPKDFAVLELLLRLDVLEKKRELAESHVRSLLKLDANNALANYIRGSLQVELNEFAMAEDSFRKSLERKKTPDAMNDLAWLLQRRELYDEAENLARAAVGLDNRMPAAWDTMGVILMKKVKLDESEKALEKAMALSPNNISILLHMAQLQVLKGNKQKAVAILGTLSSQQGRLSGETFSDFEKVKKALGSM